MVTHLLVTVGNAGATGLAQGTAPDIPWFRILVVLILCLALAVAAIGFIRVRHGLPLVPDRFALPLAQPKADGGSHERLTIVERLSAGPTSQFVILGRGDQRYLLHISQNGATEIDRFCDEADRTEEIG